MVGPPLTTLGNSGKEKEEEKNLMIFNYLSLFYFIIHQLLFVVLYFYLIITKTNWKMEQENIDRKSVV